MTELNTHEIATIGGGRAPRNLDEAREQHMAAIQHILDRLFGDQPDVRDPNAI